MILAAALAGCGGGGDSPNNPALDVTGVWSGTTSLASRSLSFTVSNNVVTRLAFEYATSGSSCSNEASVTVSNPAGATITANTFEISGPITGSQALSGTLRGAFSSKSMASGTFTVTDACGMASGTWMAAPGNAVPRAGAGSDRTVINGSVVTLSGTASDVNDDPVTYAWLRRTHTVRILGRFDRVSRVYAARGAFAG